MVSKLLSSKLFSFKLTVCLCFLAVFSSCSINSEPEPQRANTTSISTSSSSTKVTESKISHNLETHSSSRPSLVSINSLGLAPIKLSSAKVGKEVGNFDLIDVQDELKSAFRASTNTEVVAISEIKGATKEALSGDIDSLLAFAKKNKIDGLLVAEIQSFSDRSGSALGTNQGAEFGVVLKVIDVQSTKIAWEGSYFEQGNSGPLISVSGGELHKPEFRSVQSLIKEGFAKLGADFAAARLQTYLVK